MRSFFRLTAYVFLALAGLTAWQTAPPGWRRTLGMALFFLASVRVFVLVFSRIGAGKKMKSKKKLSAED